VHLPTGVVQVLHLVHVIRDGPFPGTGAHLAAGRRSPKFRQEAAPRCSRTTALAVLLVAVCLVAIGGCGTRATGSLIGPAASRSPQGSVSGGGSRGCGGQPLSCEQLVALGLSYPYPRQPDSFLFVNGVAYPYVNLGHQSLMDAAVRAGGMVLSAQVLLDRLGLGSQASQALTPVIAYGANANVDALTRKFVTSDFSGQAVIPVIKGTLQDFDVTWSPELVFNGAMPATIVSSPGTTVSVWITWLDRAELEQMNVTEGVGTQYSYGFLSGVRLNMPGPAVTRPGIYVDCSGALDVRGSVLAVSGVPAAHRRFPAVDSSGALARAAAALGWLGPVFDLLLDNVRSPALRASRSRSLKTLGVQIPERGYTVTSSCA
jgi:hypothetical protein